MRAVESAVERSRECSVDLKINEVQSMNEALEHPPRPGTRKLISRLRDKSKVTE